MDKAILDLLAVSILVGGILFLISSFGKKRNNE